MNMLNYEIELIKNGRELKILNQDIKLKIKNRNLWSILLIKFSKIINSYFKFISSL